MSHCEEVHGTKCPVAEPANAAAFRIAAHDLYVARDKSHLNDGDVNIDDNAVVSEGDEGAYVAAWVWVPNAAAGLPDPDEDDPGQDDYDE